MAIAPRTAVAAAVLMVAALALDACIAGPPPVQTGVSRGSNVAVAPSIPPAPPPARPARKPLPPAPATVPPTEEPAKSFDRLHGLDEAETIALLGQPKERAEAPPAVLWRYASRDCDLDLYFYLDLQSRQKRILHYEVRDHDERDQRSQQRCYRELITDRHLDEVGSTDRPR